MKIQLKGRVIPRNAKGDPAFQILGMQGQPLAPEGKNTNLEVLGTFTEAEVVELVNRALYQLEYQHESHRVRGQAQRDREKRVREKVKELFRTSWMKATPAQIEQAVRVIEKEDETTGT